MSTWSVTAVQSESDIAAIRTLFEAYTQSLGIDLTFQAYESELADLPGNYAKPAGALLLARDEYGEAIGCVALRSLRDKEIAEMKRLYVSPAGRGKGLGIALAEAIIHEARDLGYKAIRLDTLPTMKSAQALYTLLGFTCIPPYYTTPIADTVFLEKQLYDTS